MVYLSDARAGDLHNDAESEACSGGYGHGLAAASSNTPVLYGSLPSRGTKQMARCMHSRVVLFDQLLEIAREFSNKQWEFSL